eukprot:889328-Pleurochrysis_carterae.AAC.1
MLDEIRALIRAHEAARSSGRALIRKREVAKPFGQAATRVSDPHIGVEHHRTSSPRASGSGVSTVSKPSSPDMVNIPTQREPLNITIPPLSLKLHEETESGLLHRIRTNPRPRLKHHHTPQRASGSWRTPEATVPSGTKADDVFSPRRPRNLSPD